MSSEHLPSASAQRPSSPPSASQTPSGTREREHPDDRREIELKLGLTAKQAIALRREMQALGATRTPMVARYVDTADGLLARHGISLRLRQEGRQWIQTLKVSDAQGPAGRLEHEAPVTTGGRGEPAVDLTRHGGTEAGEALQRLLDDQGRMAPLQERLRTSVERWHCDVVRGPARIALSLDQGEMRAGSRTQPILEAEVELRDGPPAALTAACADLIARHGLFLRHASKATQGELLRAAAPQPVVKARPSTLRPSQRRSGPAIVRTVILDCLAHVLPNAEAVATGSTDEDHVHQLRVGLRRLRTALRDLAPLD